MISRFRGIPATGATLAAAGAVAVPWLASSFTVSILTYALVVGIAGLSAHVLAVCGQPTLDRAAYLGVGAYCAALTSTWWNGWLAVQLTAAVLTGAAAAAVMGLAVVRTRAMVTLLVTFCLGELAVTTATHMAVTGAGNGLSTTEFVLWPGGEPVAGAGPVYLCVLAVAAVCTALVVSLQRSRAGLSLRAISTNESRMAASGYHVTAHLWVAYVIAGAVAGAAGAALIMARGYVSPSDIGFDVAAMTLAAALLGGRSVALTMLTAAGLVAVRDIAGMQLAGYGPLLLGAALILAAVAGPHKRGEPA